MARKSDRAAVASFLTYENVNWAPGSTWRLQMAYPSSQRRVTCAAGCREVQAAFITTAAFFATNYDVVTMSFAKDDALESWRVDHRVDGC